MKGFSFLETMIALALLGGIAVTFTELKGQLNTDNDRIEDTIYLQKVVKETVLVLRSKHLSQLPKSYQCYVRHYTRLGAFESDEVLERSCPRSQPFSRGIRVEVGVKNMEEIRELYLQAGNPKLTFSNSHLKLPLYGESFAEVDVYAVQRNEKLTSTEVKFFKK